MVAALFDLIISLWLIFNSVLILDQLLRRHLPINHKNITLKMFFIGKPKHSVKHKGKKIT